MREGVKYRTDTGAEAKETEYLPRSMYCNHNPLSTINSCTGIIAWKKAKSKALSIELFSWYTNKHQRFSCAQRLALVYDIHLPCANEIKARNFGACHFRAKEITIVLLLEKWKFVQSSVSVWHRLSDAGSKLNCWIKHKIHVNYHNSNRRTTATRTSVNYLKENGF